jgi:hypothetical protein
MGDPVGAVRHIASTLSDNGTFMLVEPFAGDSLGSVDTSAQPYEGWH